MSLHFGTEVKGRGGAWHPTARRPRLIYLAAIVTALAVINAMALWGDTVAHRGEAILQLSTGLGAVACGIVMARRMSGTARWWRLFFVAALVCWLLGQVLWWTDPAGWRRLQRALRTWRLLRSLWSR